MPTFLKNNRTVLIIAYYFPPAGGGGVQRPTKFVKYLPEFDWQPVVLTATEDSFVQTDHQQVKDISESVTIVRVKPWLSKRQTLGLRTRTGACLPNEINSQFSIKARLAGWIRTWILIPDSQIFWVIPAVIKLRKLLRKNNPDIIFATGPPYSVFLLGLLAKWFSKKPLVSDFRDPWSQWFTNIRKDESGLRKKIENFLESTVIQISDYVISPTKSMVRYFQKTFPHERSKKFKLIYNGFDVDDYRNIPPKKFDRFTIVYTGKVVPDFYSAVPFLKGYTKLIEKNPSFRKKIDVRFIGAFEDDEAMSMIKAHKLNDSVKIHGYLSHSECISYQLGAHLLLLLQNQGLKESITGKLFEYLFVGKPIMAVIPQDSLAIDILDAANVAKIIQPEDTANIAGALEKFCLSDRDGVKQTANINQFNRKHQTGELASIFEQLCQDPSGDK